MIKLGKGIVTFALVTTFVVSIAVDWNDSHIYNPEWPPHARFHDILLLLFMTQLGLLLAWLMWREGAREVDVLLATLYTVFFWTPFFYIQAIVPSSSLGVGGADPTVHLIGLGIYVNAIVGFVEAALATAGFFVYRRGLRRAAPATSRGAVAADRG